MNFDRIDRQAISDIFKHLGQRISYQKVNQPAKYCRAIIQRGSDDFPNQFESQVLDSSIRVYLRVKCVGRPQMGDHIAVRQKLYVVDRVLEDDGQVVKVSVR